MPDVPSQWPNPNCPFPEQVPGQIGPTCPNPGQLFHPPLFSAGPPGGPGANGVNNGLVLLTGTGVPAPTLGADGDLYVDTVGNALYYKIAGAWSTVPIGGTTGVAGGDLQGTYPDPTLIDVGTVGTYTKVTTDANGRVTAGAQLTAADIPGGVELQANKDMANGYAGLDGTTLLKTAEFPAFTGDVTSIAGGVATTIAAGAVTNTKLANMAANTVKANLSGISAAPSDVTTSALAAALSVAVTAVKTVKTQVFTATGTYTPSTGMLYCIAEVIGGGGGGGGAAGAASQSAAAGGGGGGGYGRKTFAAATIGASQAVTIGAAANGGTAGANNGTNGNASSLGALLSASGGAAGGGATSSAAYAGTSGGAGGVGSSGDINIVGTAGGNGISFGAAAAGIGGSGGGSHLGGGVAGGTVTGAGVAGSNYGAGGSGGAAAASSVAGGAGAPGLVVITEFCSQ
jgi:hypothetical protein